LVDNGLSGMSVNELLNHQWQQIKEYHPMKQIFLTAAGNEYVNKAMIEELVKISKPTVHAIIDSLCALGYLSSHEIGRRKMYTLSTLGQELFKVAQADYINNQS